MTLIESLKKIGWPDELIESVKQVSNQLDDNTEKGSSFLQVDIDSQSFDSTDLTLNSYRDFDSNRTTLKANLK